MMRRSCVLAIAGSAVIAWASNTSVTNVDAVSTATVHVNMTFTLPLATTADGVTITWTQIKRKGQGTGTLTYGTSTSTLVTKAVTNAERDAQKIELTGLSPKTTYSIRLQFADQTHKPFADTATITTKPSTYAVGRNPPQKDIPLESFDRSISPGSKAKIGDRIAVVDLQGKTLGSWVISGSEQAVRIPSYIKGIVYLTCSRNGNIIASRKVTIMQ